MDKKEVLEEFYKQVDTFLVPHKFKLSKGKSIAKRKTKFGFDSLFFDANDRIDGYSITTSIQIRNNTIQEIRGEVNPRFKNRKETSSILEVVASVLARFDKIELRYEIENPGNMVKEETLEPYLAAFKRFMNEVCFSFFDRFQSMQDYDDWFNLSVLDGTYDFEKGLNWNDSVCGLIAAKLSENPRYEEIYEKWSTGISSKDTETLEELAATKKYLDQYKVGSVN